MLYFFIQKSFPCPSARSHIVNISCLIFVSISINFIVSAQESSLVKSVSTRHIVSFANLIHLCVKYVTTSRTLSIFLPSKYQNFSVIYRTSTKPILNIIFKTLRPHLNQFPIRCLSTFCIKSFNVSDRWFIAAHHINIPISNGNSSRQISISI